MESGNFEEAQFYFTRARLSLSDSLEQLEAGCGADVYLDDFCQGEKADILDCKMEVATFYENPNKLIEVSNPELNCDPTMASLRAADARCTILREQYPGILDEWKNITPPEKIRSMCNLTET